MKVHVFVSKIYLCCFASVCISDANLFLLDDVVLNMNSNNLIFTRDYRGIKKTSFCLLYRPVSVLPDLIKMLFRRFPGGVLYPYAVVTTDCFKIRQDKRSRIKTITRFFLNTILNVNPMCARHFVSISAILCQQQ